MSSHLATREGGLAGLVVAHHGLPARDVDAVDPAGELRPVEHERRQLVVVSAEAQLQVLGLELAARLGLASQVAEQVELEPPHRGAQTRLARGDREKLLLRVELLEQDRLGGLQVGAGHLRSEPAVGRLEHGVRVAAAHELLRIGRELLRAQDALDEPLDRAVRERLERARREAPRGERGQHRRVAQAIRAARLAAWPAERQRALPLGLGGRLLGPPRDVRERALLHTLGQRTGEQVLHLLDQERLHLRAALLVREARRQHEQRARRASSRRRRDGARGRARPRGRAAGGRSTSRSPAGRRRRGTARPPADAGTRPPGARRRTRRRSGARGCSPAPRPGRGPGGTARRGAPGGRRACRARAWRRASATGRRRRGRAAP